MVFPYLVKHNNKFYRAGEDVPVGVVETPKVAEPTQEEPIVAEVRETKRGRRKKVEE